MMRCCSWQMATFFEFLFNILYAFVRTSSMQHVRGDRESQSKTYQEIVGSGILIKMESPLCSVAKPITVMMKRFLTTSFVVVAGGWWVWWWDCDGGMMENVEMGQAASMIVLPRGVCRRRHRSFEVIRHRHQVLSSHMKNVWQWEWMKMMMSELVIINRIATPITTSRRKGCSAVVGHYRYYLV